MTISPEDYLSQARRLDLRIQRLVDEARGLEATLDGVRAVRYDQEPVSGTPSGRAPYEIALERLSDMRAGIARRIEILTALKRQIRETIDTVPDDDERAVLEYRYLYDRPVSWEDIASLMNASRTTVWRWHKAALEHMTMPEEPIIA